VSCLQYFNDVGLKLCTALDNIWSKDLIKAAKDGGMQNGATLAGVELP
jgi:hypothetical protein